MKFFRRKKVDKILDKFVENDTMVTFNELCEMPINETIDINEGITCVRVHGDRQDQATFRVEMKRGRCWSRHRHNCNETIVMYKGKIKDDITGEELKKGGYLYIPAGNFHVIEALEDAIFYVEFQKAG